jgi:succinyl-diaminopimelate desuccinylase
MEGDLSQIRGEANQASDAEWTPLERDVLHYLDQHSSELVQLLCSLIAIPTPNPPGDNYQAFCDFAADWLREAGLDVEVVAAPEDAFPDMLRPEAAGQRYAVLGCLKGAADHPAFCLQGHYDTVPASEDWETDPYDPQVVEGKLYGLGSTDMKGGLASMMLAAKALAQQRVPLRGSLCFLTTPDEELPSRVGLAYFLENGIVDADFAVVGEPSGVRNIHIGMKGGIWGDIIVRGRAAHGSQPFVGVNAFEKMVEVASALRSKLMPRLEKRVSSYDFHPREGNRPTLVLGGIVSGTNASRATVPDRCSVSFDRRIIPEESLEEAEQEIVSFLDELQNKDEQLSLEVKVSSKAPSMIVPADAEICGVMSDVIKKVAGGQPTHTVSCGGFETVLFVDRGLQAVTYGPGVEACAHAAGEHTIIGDLAVTAKVYALTALRLLE